jgi:hypothetical protein
MIQTGRPRIVADPVVRAIAASPGMKLCELHAKVGGKPRSIATIVTRLAQDGAVVAVGQKSHKRYFISGAIEHAVPPNIRETILAFIAAQPLGASVAQIKHGVAPLTAKQVDDSIWRMSSSGAIRRLAKRVIRGHFFVTAEAMAAARPALEAKWRAEDEAIAIRRREEARLRECSRRREAGAKVREPKPPKPPKAAKPIVLRKAGSSVRSEAAQKRGPASRRAIR